MCSLWILEKCLYFRPLMLLRVYSNRFLRYHTGMVVPRVFRSFWKLLAFDKIQLDAYCAAVWRRFEATFKLWPVIPICERNEMTECPTNHDNQPQQESHGISNPFPSSRYAVSRIGFSSARVLPPGFLPRGQSILWGGHPSLNWIMLQCPAAFLFE